MEVLFSKDFELLWALLLALVLFYPVRQLIWVLYVRRAQKQGETDEDAKRRLKRRSSMTAALLCFVFAFLYTNQLFQDRP